ncbi:hypothetical protein [Bacteroides bouchesdurhonensis]|nr:hypothetical protein [Bacteroides bouchesdurhonensis]
MLLAYLRYLVDIVTLYDWYSVTVFITLLLCNVGYEKGFQLVEAFLS